VRFRDLGTLVVEVDGVERPTGGKKPATILSLLLISANRRVSADAIMDAVWEGAVTDRSAATLESHVWRLRRLLEPNRATREAPSVLINDSGGYRLLVDPADVDSLRFEQLSGEARDLLAAGQAARSLRRSDDALALWRGRPHEPNSDAPWALAAVSRLEEMQSNVRGRRIETLISLGEYEGALSDLEPLIAELPYREGLWSQRMLALHHLGRTEDALQAFRRAREALDELGLEPGPELQDLQRRILQQDPGLAAAPQPVRSSAPAAVHLPIRGTALIGRADDVAQLGALIGEYRMVTLTGTGGCGKTRLSIEVARSVADGFPDGVWFIDLTAVDDPERVVDVVVSTIGVAAPAVGTALDALRTYARDRRMLLVLDNCEHLLGAVDALLTHVLGDDSECRVFATSREPVGVDGEVIWTLGPLPVPLSSRGLSDSGYEGELESSTAVQLFLARMRAAKPQGEVGPDELKTIADICVAVDGVPLAIELAAARVRTFALDEILEQVSHDPTGLARIGRGPDDHRQSLGAAIEWSHRLLTAQEQVMHRRLSVLPGPFTSACAAAVVADSPAMRSGAEALLGSLVHKSMLSSRPSERPHGPSLFSQLATVRAHAKNALAAADETQEIARRRNNWVRELMDVAPQMSHTDRGWYDVVEDAYPTVRAALQHSLLDVPDPGVTTWLPRLTMFWYYRNRMVEGEWWLLRALLSPAIDPVDRLLMRLQLTGLLILRGRIDLARPHIESGLTDPLPADPARVVQIGEHLTAVALAALASDEFDLLGAFAERMVALAAAHGDADLTLLAAGLTCLAELPTTDTAVSAERAAALYDQAVARDNLLAAWIACGVRTTIARLVRDADDGIRWSSRTLQMVSSLGARQLSVFLETRANFTSLAEQPLQAIRLYAASKVRARRAGMPWPRRPVTNDLLQQAADVVSQSDYQRAWSDGESQRTGELMYHPIVG
jgi:predicted ATPase/DNA-binding SARP family transcriptional activator